MYRSVAVAATAANAGPGARGAIGGVSRPEGQRQTRKTTPEVNAINGYYGDPYCEWLGGLVWRKVASSTIQ